MRRTQGSQNPINLVIALMTVFLTAACIITGGRDSTQEKPSPTASPTDQSTPVANKTENPDSKEDAGDFKVEYQKLSSSRFESLDKKVKNERLLENAAEDLNRALKLPEDVFLTARDCGEANAEFDPNTQTITVCYELMQRFYNLYRSDGIGPDEADEKMFDAIRFVFLHEVGHAMIYNYKLPIMGNEEDAADRCSSYINIEELGDKGVKAVLAAADGFRIDSRRESRSKRDLADEHLLQEQRFYNSLCMIYGSNPDKYEYFVDDGYLPEDRARRCPQEYQRTVDSWVNLLAPWRKEK